MQWHRKLQNILRRTLLTTVTPSLAATTSKNKRIVQHQAIMSRRTLVFNKSTGRWTIFFVALAGFFSPLSANIYFPALNYLAHDLHVSLKPINLTITAYLVCQEVVPFIFGDAADTIGRRLVYVAAIVIYLAANIGLALQDSYPALHVLRVLQSSGASGWWDAV